MLQFHAELVRLTCRHSLNIMGCEPSKHARDCDSKYIDHEVTHFKTQVPWQKKPTKKRNSPFDLSKHTDELAKELAPQVTLASDQGAVVVFIDSPSCRDILQTVAQPLLGPPSAFNRESISLSGNKRTEISRNPRLFSGKMGPSAAYSLFCFPSQSVTHHE